MDLYKVEIAPSALKQLETYINYIQNTLLNPAAADNVMLDALDTITQLEAVAGSLQYCSKESLRDRGYRKINFLRHDYVMIYSLVDHVVQVKAIYRQLQIMKIPFSKKSLFDRLFYIGIPVCSPLVPSSSLDMSNRISTLSAQYPSWG